MLAATANPESIEADGRAHVEFVTGELARISSANQIVHASIMRLASCHGFTVTSASAPLYRGYTRTLTSHLHRRVERSASNTASEESGRVKHVCTERMSFDARDMQNEDHLTSSGAVRHSERLADVLRRLSSGNRGQVRESRCVSTPIPPSRCESRGVSIKTGRRWRQGPLGAPARWKARRKPKLAWCVVMRRAHEVPGAAPTFVGIP
jgi:hypothetical protein